MRSQEVTKEDLVWIGRQEVMEPLLMPATYIAGLCRHPVVEPLITLEPGVYDHYYQDGLVDGEAVRIELVDDKVLVRRA